MISLEKLVGEIPFKEFPLPIVYTCEYGFQANNGRIEVLSIFDKGLDVFPESILQLNNLKVLELSGHRFNSIPLEISKLTNLETLILCNNSLLDLPDSIGDLKSLQYLVLEISKLYSIPDAIGNLQNLKLIKLNDNIKLPELPNSIWSLMNLEWLNLHNTSISYIPEIVDNLKNLRYLNISTDPGTNLPITLKNLKRLEELYLTWRDTYYETIYSDEEEEMVKELKQRGVKISRNGFAIPRKGMFKANHDYQI